MSTPDTSTGLRKVLELILKQENGKEFLKTVYDIDIVAVGLASLSQEQLEYMLQLSEKLADAFFVLEQLNKVGVSAGQASFMIGAMWAALGEAVNHDQSFDQQN